jgi:ion channel POLLUX/CASTOR
VSPDPHQPSPTAFEANARHRQGKALYRRSRGPAADGNARPLRTRATAGSRLRYRFDNALSRGPSVVIGWLGLVTIGLIVITAMVLALFRVVGVNGGRPLGLGEALWQSLLRVVDGGTFAADAGWTARLIGLAITLAGIFIAGSLIGLIANAVDQQIEQLRKGRSHVLEDRHTLILGWSDRVPSIVSELVVANESAKRATVVVLSPHEKTEMEESLRLHVPDTRTTHVVCRSGEPWLTESLAIANASAARSIIVVGGHGDAVTVKTLLALKAADVSAPVVAELTNHETAETVKALLGDRIVTVNSDDVVAELTAQACRQRGLSAVFREFLDFDGDELYVASFPALVGKTYREAQLCFDRASLIGRLHDGEVELNPSPDAVLATGDELIGIAEDDSVFVPSGNARYDALATIEIPRAGQKRRIVVAGWSTLGPRVLAELDDFLDSDTTAVLMLDPDLVDVEAVRASVQTNNIGIEIIEQGGGPEVVASRAAHASFHEVIVLGHRGEMSADDADARTLLTLLAFGQVRQADSLGKVRMVAELLDQRHAPLASISGADDFVVSDQLTSLMLAQLSERLDLKRIFDDLFDRSGASVGLRSARVFQAEKATSYGQIVATASTLGESAIGFRRAATGDVVVNPSKSSNPNLTADDEIIVLAVSKAEVNARV